MKLFHVCTLLVEVWNCSGRKVDLVLVASSSMPSLEEANEETNKSSFLCSCILVDSNLTPQNIPLSMLQKMQLKLART